MHPSLASADGSANDGTPRRGVSPEERRRLRSLLCGAGSARLPCRTPGGGVFGPRRASCASCTTSSLALAPVFCPRRAAYCCNSTFFSFGPALWWSAAARAMAIDCCSCLSMARSRRPRRRWATPVTGCPLATIAIQVTQRNNGHTCVRWLWWWWWCVCDVSLFLPKTTLCFHSNRSRVYLQNAPVCRQNARVTKDTGVLTAHTGAL